ncbi:hypothetical protein EJ08DRAFT_410293 [Tothia fuscella]|uniref:Cell wall protein n=1 Tax=Tothia fuscella TaxID=1048955 RepID=A0A9P4NKL7_9PEZI|nr:hypothetical protein EJ08DRAFT_410293 [Tothia fuscella]
MYFPTLLTLGLAVNTLAAPNPILVSRSVNDIKTAIKSVQKSLDSLDTAVRALNSSTDAKALSNIATKATALSTTINTAMTKVMNTQPIGLVGATMIQSAADGLASSVIKVSKDLVKKKVIIQMAGLTQVVGQMLAMQKNQSSGFTNAVVSKVPTLAQGIAIMQGTKANTALDMVIKAYAVNGTAATLPAPSTAVPAPVAAAPAVPVVPKPASDDDGDDGEDDGAAFPSTPDASALASLPGFSPFLRRVPLSPATANADKESMQY